MTKHAPVHIRTWQMNPALQWNDSLLLGHGAMDRTHRDFVACVARLRHATQADVSRHLAGMLHHLVAHFEEEREWMMQTDFPATQCHVDEHDAVLRSGREVQTLVEAGAGVSEARRFADALAAWFDGHLHYMDAALAHWMTKRAHGGAPLVLRRNLPASPLPEGASI